MNIHAQANSHSLYEQIRHLLSRWHDPLLEGDLLTHERVKELTIQQECVYLEIELNFAANQYQHVLAHNLKHFLLENSFARDVTIEISWQVATCERIAATAKGIKQIIAVASGKGGVGKSTTTTNIALALAREGARVGILDADLYGPSQPKLLGLTGDIQTENGQMIPLQGHGIYCMSIGFLVDEQAPVIWRGPMITQALMRLLQETAWPDLDYLIVDLPPGTGDIHLTLAQRIPVSGAVIVTTPQDLALLDAQKGIAMFNKVNIPILGVVENMSLHTCSCCGHQEPIFGQGGARSMAEQQGFNLLGELPLDIRIRQGSDAGIPVGIAEPDGSLSQAYSAIARKAAALLSLHSKAKLTPVLIEE